MTGLRHLSTTVALVLLAAVLTASGPVEEIVRTPATAGSVPYQVPAIGPSVALVDFGAVCDGIADDREAFAEALAHLEALGGGTLELPPRRCLVHLSAGDPPFLVVPSHVTVQGLGKASRVDLSCEEADSYVELFRLMGESIALRDLHLDRVGDCYGVMVALYVTHGLTIDHVAIDGHSDVFGQAMQGLDLREVEGTSRALLLDSVVLRRLEYGLLQANDVASSIIGITVRDSRFLENLADDLEFNAPSGLMQRVLVQDSVFRDNQATEDGAGIGVGLANVQDVRIVRNDFEGYRFEPVHLEDGSARVVILDNVFRDAFTAERAWASHVFVINGSYAVRIRGNFFDASANDNTVRGVYLGAGGDGLQAPRDVVVEHNRLMARGEAAVVVSEGNEDIVVRDNQVTRLE